MTKTLLESDFLVTDISSFFNKKVQPEEGTKATTTSNQNDKPKNVGSTDIAKKRPANFNWEKELQTRLAANKELSPEARQTETEIEQKFWKEFFTNKWPADVAELLDRVVGEQLKKDIRILGFTPKTNPIIAFLKLKYVQDKLIKTKLLNDHTYRAIHNAVAKNLVADSEFFTATDYNIIYCQDLYTKSAGIIEKYLNYQKQNLPTNASKYTLEMQNENKKIFLAIRKLNLSKLNSTEKAQAILQNDSATKLSVKSANIKLNDIKTIEEILKLNGKIPKEEETEEIDGDNKQTSNDAVLKQANSLKTPAEAYAALQYIAMSTQNSLAQRALSDEKLSGISAEALVAATKVVTARFSKIKVTKDNADSLTKHIMTRLKTGAIK